MTGPNSFEQITDPSACSFALFIRSLWWDLPSSHRLLSLWRWANYRKRRLATYFLRNRKYSAIENIPHTLFHTQIYTPIQSFSSHLYINLLCSHLGSRVSQSVGRSTNQIAETRRHHKNCMGRSQRRIMAVKAAVVTRAFYLKIIITTLWHI